MNALRLIAAIVAFVIAYWSLHSIRPLTPGAVTAGNKLEIPYSWDISSHNTPLAVVTPPKPAYLRVSSFNVYQDGRWVREGGSFGPGVLKGNTYTISITPFAVLLYPAFPVPQPYPGTLPKVMGGTENGDTFTFNGFKTQVVAKYTDPFPKELFPQLFVPLSQVAIFKPKHWSTKRVQELAQKLYNDFKGRTLYALLDYMTNWLRHNYKYTLTYTGTPGKDPVDWFLFVSKTGMCMHFASAAAVLLNDMGIKARVVYGFAVSYQRGDFRVFVTPTHLWVEVWVPNVGWIPWDPSPPAALRINAPQAVGGGGGIAPPVTPQKAPTAPGRGGGGGRISVNLRDLVPYLTAFIVILILFFDTIKKWLLSWPVAFRECAERKIGKKGLTLRELAEITGIKELEEVQVEYLKRGKWLRKGFWKALKWCLSKALGR
ncbi:hypothetical protein IPA_08160 [Ignicoccus pacificus DSM 13166]|uniref:Transglutaminase-like domain-containing protein n=1 Tax=Ignicoccus pacificus DSM 13166 TaxID=940294 RepID=A0A977KBT9_9CREN|nr:hypothetical protein IPA_08160 [Ignicoccus pacificus DSM 13166]